MKIYEKTDPELRESHRTRMAKYVAAHKEVGILELYFDLKLITSMTRLVPRNALVKRKTKIPM